MSHAVAVPAELVLNAVTGLVALALLMLLVLGGALAPVTGPAPLARASALARRLAVFHPETRNRG
uniref:Uncharacterized protein n=1 Tax=Nonomuraea gerenzanensis TaxID=93944 RepID=A0A1M4EFX0_9ACTN|nr:hypothetical protein BN4615_P7373 [Nonomuraea gerenzanensis]